MENYPSQSSTWVSMFGAPVLWSLQFLGIWIISEAGCRLGGASTFWFGIPVIHVLVLGLSIVTLVMIAIVGLISLSLLRETRISDESVPQQQLRVYGRIHFMAQIGLAFTMLFFMISTYLTITVFLIPLC